MTQEIQLSVSDLKNALPGLSKVVPKRANLPVLTCVRISQNDENVSIEATDLESTLQFTTPQKSNNKPATILVPLEHLLRLVKITAKDGTLCVSCDKKHTLIDYTVGTQRLQRTLPYLDEKEWPVIPKVDEPSIPLTEQFPSVFQTALTCAHTDTSRLALMGGWLDVTDPNAHYVFASDGRHLFSANSFTFDLKESLLIPTHKFLQWNGFVEAGAWTLALHPKSEKNDGWVKLQSEHWTFITKQPEAQCPNWKQIVPDNFKCRVNFNEAAQSFLKTVFPTLPGAEENNSPVLFKFNASGTTVSGQSKEGKATPVPIEGITIKGKSAEIAVNRDYVLKAFAMGLTELGVVDSLTPMVFSAGGRKLVISPLRMEGTMPPGQPKEPQEAATETNNSEPAPEEMKTTPPSQSTTPSDKTPENAVSGLKHAITKVESIKEGLKTLLSDMTEVVKVLGQAQKEQRATDKEIEEVRDALQSLQKIRI